ncbi:GspE/PulE family protein [Novosphingobium sp.]|uniref:GspE/PulE family protein n=1 Tax=Novosphingobium sp. TaxID=1874826 RepID=UPI002628E397|nr:GspE/PulE family protein [Novosphingobium sp.]
MPGASDGRKAQHDQGSIAAVLEDRALLSREALSRARLVQQESGERIESVVTRLGLMSEQSLCEHLSDASGMPMAPAELLREPVTLEQPITAEFLRDIRAVPIAVDDERVCVAVGDPFDPFIENAFRFMFRRRVDQVIARASDIEAAIERLCHEGAEAAVIEDAVESDDIDRMRDLTSDAPAIRAVNRLIAEAVDANASDIHLEPSDDSLVVRFRIDGMLRLVTRLPQAMRASVVARIKVMAGLDIAERRIPQDGRLRLAVRGHEIDLRVATAPSIHGESAVLRILDRSNLKLEFAALGLDDQLVEQFREAIHRPYGIMLVTGPTGSGKTTTLYAALAELNQVERKLLTVEDPIEYRLPGIVQTQVQPGIGFTFATALRSFLRQDPDAIMVGEIRDVETAQIAVQAALTGHMILSTLHTNTAAGAITRLIDMEVEPFLLSSVLAGVLAQRLVRRLCLQCRVPFVPDEALLTSLDFDAAAGDESHFHRAAGCAACHGTGYSGRIALFDFLPVDEAIARLILKRADARQIEECANAAGHRSLLQEGFAKAAQGLTTIEEVLRVASGE